VSTNWLIRSGRVLDPKSETDAFVDVRIRDGVVAEIGENLPPGEEQVFDAGGCVVAPGLLDVHVHLRDPGQRHKESIATGTRAAAAGGFTAVACMANTAPPLDTPDRVRYVLDVASREASTTVYPIAAITKELRGQEATDRQALLDAGAVGFSDDGKTVTDTRIMRTLFRDASRMGFAVLLHCEDPMLVRAGVMHPGEVSRSLELPGLPPLAEETIIERDLTLAEETGARIHILHVTTTRGVSLIRNAKARGVRVTAETCPHYFALTHEAVREHGSNAKMNPPLRTAADAKAVTEGLADGTLDVIATDHAPHSAEEKAEGMLRAPFGIIGLEVCVPLVWTHLVRKQVLSPLDAVRKLTVGPAEALGVRVPSLAAGEPGDLTVIEPELELEITRERIYSKSRNTPFLGQTLRSWTLLTLHRGRRTFLRSEAEPRLGS